MRRVEQHRQLGRVHLHAVNRRSCACLQNLAASLHPKGIARRISSNDREKKGQSVYGNIKTSLTIPAIPAEGGGLGSSWPAGEEVAAMGGFRPAAVAAVPETRKNDGLVGGEHSPS